MNQQPLLAYNPWHYSFVLHHLASYCNKLQDKTTLSTHVSIMLPNANPDASVTNSRGTAGQAKPTRAR